MLGALLGGTAAGGSGRGRGQLRATLMVPEIELPGVLADDLDVGPAEPGKALSGNVAQRRGEVDQVHGGEELGHVYKRGHRLNVPAGASADLQQDKTSQPWVSQGPDGEKETGLTSTQTLFCLPSLSTSDLALSWAATSASMSSRPLSRADLVVS